MDVDTNTLLEWLTTSGLNDLQEMALEQLCGLLLMAEDIDTCLNMIPPKKFVPALCGLFLDPTTPNTLLEITARAIIYYLELSIPFISKYISEHEDVLRAICNKLVISPDSATVALAEECVKVLQSVSSSNPKVVLKVGGFNSILTLIKNHGDIVHRNTLHLAIRTISSSSRSLNPTDFQASVCLKDLTALLKHDDEKVAIGALTVFHSLAFKFEQRFLDPSGIAKYGLLEILTARLSAFAESSVASNQDVISNITTEPISSDPKIILMIFQIYSILCRASPSITHELIIQSNFLDVIEKVMKLNEISVLDLIKFVDVLLVLLCESRVVLKESQNYDKTVTLVSAEDLHSDIIESIRLEEFNSFISCLETTYIDIDYMDSYGQTLMNWASAIGTSEMVEVLCKKGADLTKGEHGSSLHYAVSAEKVMTVKILLKYGAPLDLKDENGKIPLDLAREGDSFTFREIAELLDNCNHWRTKNSEATQSKTEILSPEKQDNSKMAPAYLRRLLPVFCRTFKLTTLDSVRKATLKSIKAMVRYIHPGTLKELCTSDVGGQKFAIQIADTIVTVLNDEENDENQLMVLNVIESLMSKGSEIFFDAFARLGVFLQVQNLVGLESDQVAEEVVVKEAETSKTLEDATELKPNHAYHWRHWCICLCPNGFYAWCESATLEFSNNSNGWFRCFINGKLHTMYSCGLVESGSTSSNSSNSLTFLTKFDHTRRNVVISSSVPILSKPGATLVVNNWSITSPSESELYVQNLENPQQKTTLPAKVHGFLHESDNGTKHSFTSKRYIVPRDANGWLKKFKKVSAEKQAKQEMERIACSIYQKYSKSSEIEKRPAMVKLENVVMQMKSESSDEVLKNSLDELTELLVDDDGVTVYELHNSGFVQALLLLLEQQKGVQVFRQCFEEKSTNGNNMFALLVQKLIAVLESTEKLRVHVCHSYSNSLNALKNSFLLILERENGEDQLIDRTNKRLHVEPLSTVKQLEEYLWKMVIKGNASDALNESGSTVSKSTVELGSDVPADSTDSSAEMVDFDISASASGVVLNSIVTSGEVMDLDTPTSGSDSVPESIVTPGSGEMMDLDQPASESSAVPESTVTSGEVMDLGTPASESGETMDSDTLATECDAKPELAVASGSAVMDSNILKSETILPSGEVMDLDTPVLDSREAINTLETTSAAQAELVIVPELIVTSGEVMDLDTPASSQSREAIDSNTSDTVPEMAVAPEPEIMDSVTPVSESLPESAIASSSSLSTLDLQEMLRASAKKKILESKMNSGVTSESPKRETTASSDEHSSDSSFDEGYIPYKEVHWDRRFILKAQLPALLPAFDPRPGRDNINPTTDFEVLPPGVEEFTIGSRDDSPPPRKLQLVIKDVDSKFEMELTDSNYTIFRAIKELTQSVKFEPRRKINEMWQSYYKIVYREIKNDDVATKPSHSATNSSKMDDVLHLLKHLLAISTSKKIASSLALTPAQFSSKKINNKLLQQMKESLITICSSAPAWCEELIHSFSFLFPFETRQLYFQSTAFGITRSIMWFQSKREVSVDRLRENAILLDVHHLANSALGRLKTERIRVPRGDTFLQWAMQVMKMHCDRKAKLEVQFIDEEGTGLGPTLEFYALAAAELQRRDLAMWICVDDDPINAEEDANVSEDTKAPGYYVRNQLGLFPAPLPQDSVMCDQAVKYFWFLGVLLAKVLQDNRLVDLPLSKSFLKLMCHRNTKTPVDEKNPWYRGVLVLHDLHDIDPVRARFLKEIRKLVQQKNIIMQDASLCGDSKMSQIQNLSLNQASGSISLEDLALNFTYAPSSKIFGISAMELVPNGADMDVTVENIDEYSDLTLSFALETGIARQLDAFHLGFSEVFPMKKLAVFNPNELRVMLCGDQNPQWTKEDLLNYTEPKLGYTKESPGFLRFVNVLMAISPEEKKAFVQFATGCSSLPPGGLANLHPRLTVVKKIDAGEGSYPSVNTCVHYLKLPEYSTEEILKERLLTAVKETGFHFN